MTSETSRGAEAARGGRWGRAARAVLGPRDVWLPAAALILPALVWLALEGRAYPPFEPYMTGDYAKIELYTRLAAEGSQRLGTESRFHIHHLGPAFFYFAAPIYYLCGATTKGMAVAALAWNLLFLVALLRGAQRLAPRSGPFVAAVVLLAFLQARGIGWLLSSWNPHIAMLPFGVALLAGARLATGEGRGLWILALAGSVVLQGHMVWAPPLVAGAAFGLALASWPRLRTALGVPTRGDGIGRGSLLAATLIACVLWSMPVYDELTGSYRNFRRILTMGTESYESRPWADSLGPCLRALDLRRDGQAPGASFEFGARNVGVDPRLGTEADPIAGGAAFGWREVVRAIVPLIALVLAGVLARRRRSAIQALVVVSLLAAATLPVVALRSPGRELPWYLLQWGAMVTLVSLLAFGVELLERVAWLGRQARGPLGTAVLAAIPLLLVGSALARQSLAPSRPRNPRSLAVERMAAVVKERAALDIGKRRFLLRVAPHEDQALAVGLILALDKHKIPFSVEPFGSCRFEGRFTPRGNEWAELLVGNLEARPGAVRVDAGDSVSVVWQLKQAGGVP